MVNCKGSISADLDEETIPTLLFWKIFLQKNAPCTMDYMNLNEYQSIIYSPKLERKATSSLLSNKLYFALFCQANSLPSPRQLGYNMYKSFTFKEEVQLLKDEDAFLDFYEKLFDHIELDRIFVKASEFRG